MPLSFADEDDGAAKQRAREGSSGEQHHLQLPGPRDATADDQESGAIAGASVRRRVPGSALQCVQLDLVGSRHFELECKLLLVLTGHVADRAQEPQTCSTRLCLPATRQRTGRCSE